MQIEADLAAHGGRSRRANQVAWAVTRPPKTRSGLGTSAVESWEHRAADLGLDRRAVEHVVGRSVSPDRSLDEQRFADALAVDTEETARRRDVVQAWAAAIPRGAPASDIDRGVDQWAPAPLARGVSERRQSVAELVPTDQMVQLLGPRPAQPGALTVWQDAARSVNAYRERWAEGGTDPGLEPGAPGMRLSNMSARQLADHLGTRRRLEEARWQLQRSTDHSRELAREYGPDRGRG